MSRDFEFRLDLAHLWFHRQLSFVCYFDYNLFFPQIISNESTEKVISLSFDIFFLLWQELRNGYTFAGIGNILSVLFHDF